MEDVTNLAQALSGGGLSGGSRVTTTQLPEPRTASLAGSFALSGCNADRGLGKKAKGPAEAAAILVQEEGGLVVVVVVGVARLLTQRCGSRRQPSSR